MQTPLRRLAVTVDEPRRGSFRWILLEAPEEDGNAWLALQHSKDSFDRYHAAMAAGLLALQGMVEDLDVGPREVAPEAASPARHGGVFGGFGVMGR